MSAIVRLLSGIARYIAHRASLHCCRAHGLRIAVRIVAYRLRVRIAFRIVATLSVRTVAFCITLLVLLHVIARQLSHVMIGADINQR